ncbi:sunset domain-containing protein [Rhizobium laguerreae]
MSIGSGAKIYHVKGQEYYEATILRSEYGERCFCSEADARSAGWRRAGR